jgi:hypothetical protein
MPATNDELEKKKLEFERERWEADYRLRLEELSLKKSDLNRSRWINPLVIAILAAAAAALGNAAIALITSTKQLELERERATITARRIPGRRTGDDGRARIHD